MLCARMWSHSSLQNSVFPDDSLAYALNSLDMSVCTAYVNPFAHETLLSWII